MGNLAHNLKVVGSNPTPATKNLSKIKDFKAERNARLLALALYINTTSTPDTKTGIHRHPPTFSSESAEKRDGTTDPLKALP